MAFGFNVLRFYFFFFKKMPDTKLRPTSTMKSKDKSSKLRFSHVNATNLNSYLNIILIEFNTYRVSEIPLKRKIRTFEVL